MDVELKKKRIILIVPTLSAGGMEKVIAEIANYFSIKNSVDIHLVLLIKKPKHFTICNDVKVHEPKDFNQTNYFKILFYLRNKINSIDPYAIISFGSMYNSFVMLGCLGLEKKHKIYLSDRSNPYRNTILNFKKGGDERHDGIFHFFLKKILYRRAYGILCQTKLSLEIEKKFLNHKRLIYFPNPIILNSNMPIDRENIILNVGRFIESKQQSLLVQIFQNLNNKNWKLVFLGDGPKLNEVKSFVRDDFKKNIFFEGNVKDVKSYMYKSKIFAFTSRSEGFPNALAEALSTPLASISFDCIAGPSDLIMHDYNGYLIDNGKIDEYSIYLKKLMFRKDIRLKFEQNSLIKMKKFEKEVVLDNLFNEIID